MSKALIDSEYTTFKKECESLVLKQSKDNHFLWQSEQWIQSSFLHKYMYNYEALGRPIIQYPQDMVMIQEIIWKVKPDLVIETGIAHGGSLILSASMLAMLDITEAIDSGVSINPSQSNRKVLGIDIDIRKHNKVAIETHTMASRIQMIEGSSVSKCVIEEVKNIAENYASILVILDSNHTHEHVLDELNAYAPLTTLGSYCIVFDTFIEDMPEEMFFNRSWGPGNNPKTAVHRYLQSHKEFEIDKNIQRKLLITAAPDGYLKKIF